VSVARFSPDGKEIVTGGSNGHVKLWRTLGGGPINSEEQAGPVTDAELSRKSVATAGRDGASIWSHGRHLLRSPKGVSRVAFSPDGKVIATAGLDGTARLWDVETGRRLHVLRSPSRLPLTDVVFSPDGRLLLTTRLGIKNNVETWDAKTGKLEREMVGVFGSVSTGAFSPDGRWIVTAGPISGALWKTGADHPYVYLRGGAAKLQVLTAVAFSPDGKLVLSASEDGTVGLYRCEICGNLKQLIAVAEQRLATR
jgi:WD40 repeat protein